MNIKNNKGITMVDISISIMIIFLFSSLITGLVYNYSYSTRAIQRKTDATYQAVNIIEAIKTLGYDTINDQLPTEINETEIAENGIKKEEGKYKLDIFTFNDIFSTNLTMLDGYSAEIQFKKYSEDPDKDIIIIATVTVKYKLGSKEQNLQLETLLVKGDDIDEK